MLAPVAVAPDPEAEEPPFDPSAALTAVIRCGPGRNTNWPSVTVPVCVCPSDACQRSTAAVVAASKVSLIVIWRLGSKPRSTRFRFSCATSAPAVTPSERLR